MHSFRERLLVVLWLLQKLKTKNIASLVEQWIIDERGFFISGKKKNFITKSMVDQKGMDFYGMPR